MRDERNIFQNIDWFTVALFGVLVIMGWINIYAAVYNPDQPSIINATQEYGKQLIWISGAALIVVIILFTDGRIYENLAIPLYAIMMLLLLGVLLFGKEVSGAKAWFAIGSFRLQPAEMAKFTTALLIARYMGSPHVTMKKWAHRIVVIAILALPSVLIALQPDIGSVLVYGAFVLVMYREGLPGYYIAIGVWLAALFVLSLVVPKMLLISILSGIVVLAIFLLRRNRKVVFGAIAILAISIGFSLGVDYIFNDVLAPHQQVRFRVLLGQEDDPSGAGYNTRQSLIAIGSGGFMGKGFLQGTQTKFDFVPEQSTDYIFCTIGEEWGFIGTSTVVILFVVLLMRLVTLAERQKSTFARVYGYSVASILFLHFAINIAMTIGLAPVIGIPLPFFSYGGSSLWGFTILLFIFLKMDAYRMQIL